MHRTYRLMTQSGHRLPLPTCFHVRSVAEVESAIAELGRNPGCGLIAGSDIFIVGVRKVIVKSAEQHRVPVISPYRQFVVDGSLMSYGPDTADIFRRSSSYVDRNQGRIAGRFASAIAKQV